MKGKDKQMTKEKFKRCKKTWQPQPVLELEVPDSIQAHRPEQHQQLQQETEQKNKKTSSVSWRARSLCGRANITILDR